MTEPTATVEPIYTSRIIKATALIADTRLLLNDWRLHESVADNLERIERDNIFGKASRRRVDDIMRIFRQRYFDDPDIGIMLVKLSQAGAPAQWLDSLLYFFSAQNDRTLRDVVLQVVAERQAAGFQSIDTDHVLRRLRQWISEGATTSAWGEETQKRVARNSLATLRDFGVLQGKANKRLAPVYLPLQAFVLIARWLDRQLHAGQRVLHSEDWQLFFLPVAGVERFFIEAHQEHLLHYQAAGSIVRIDFPADTLSDYADQLIERYLTP